MLVAIGYILINNQINYLKKEESGITFYLPRSNSFASNWNYKMSNPNVLREVEEDCFSITYYVDEERNVTEISSENRPENLNFKGREGNLLFLKIYDEWLLHLRNLLARIFGVWA